MLFLIHPQLLSIPRPNWIDCIILFPTVRNRLLLIVSPHLRGTINLIRAQVTTKLNNNQIKFFNDDSSVFLDMVNHIVA